MSDSRYDDERWTPEDFIEKYDYEGGLDGMLGWGGPGCFPPELRDAATEIERQSKIISVWLAENGY